MLEIKTTGEDSVPAKLRVIGAGDVGSRAVHRMKDEQIVGVEWVAADDIDPKEDPCAANPAAMVRGANIVIVVCGMGDETGIGGASAIAKAAREQGILTVGMVSKPFGFDKAQRMENAPSGIARLKEHVDTLIVIPDDRPSEAVDGEAISEAQKALERALLQIVRLIAESMNVPMVTNLDLADVSMCLKNKGGTFVGTGRAEGYNKALEAARYAVENPLTKVALDGAGHAIIYVAGDITLEDIQDAAGFVQEAAGGDVASIIGASYDGTMEDAMEVTIIATGCKKLSKKKPSEPKPKPEGDYCIDTDTRIKALRALEKVMEMDKDMRLGLFISYITSLDDLAYISDAEFERLVNLYANSFNAASGSHWIKPGDCEVEFYEGAVHDITKENEMTGYERYKATDQAGKTYFPLAEKLSWYDFFKRFDFYDDFGDRDDWDIWPMKSDFEDWCVINHVTRFYDMGSYLPYRYVPMYVIVRTGDQYACLITNSAKIPDSLELFEFITDGDCLRYSPGIGKERQSFKVEADEWFAIVFEAEGLIRPQCYPQHVYFGMAMRPDKKECEVYEPCQAIEIFHEMFAKCGEIINHVFGRCPAFYSHEQ